jgi:hypothetical protein
MIKSNWNDVLMRVHRVYIYIIIYIYGKSLGFAGTRNDDRRRIIIIIRLNPY